MASIFEIARRLRSGEELVIDAKYSGTVMQQFEVHAKDIGEMRPIKFDISEGKCTMKIEALTI